MKKNILKILSLVMFVGFASCQDDDQDYPTEDAKPLVSLSQPSYSGVEGQAVTITLNLDKPSRKSTDLKLELLDDSQFEDLSFGGISEVDISSGWGDLPAYAVIIPANTTTFSFTVTLEDDEVFSADKVYQFKIAAAGNLNGVFSTGPEAFFNVTFSNTVSNSLNLTFDWDKSFDLSGTNYSLCEIEYDVDILVLDSNFDDLGIVDAQTGDCPEHLSMSLEDFEDGTYYLAGYLYENQGLNAAGLPTFDIPMNITYNRGGSATLAGENTFVSPFMTSDSANDAVAIVAIVVVQNGVFTIKNASNVTIASGKQNNIKNILKAKRKLKK